MSLIAHYPLLEEDTRLINSGVTYVDDELFGKAAYFNGSSYLQTRDKISVPSGDKSWSLWAKLNESKAQHVLDARSDGGGYQPFCLDANNKLQFYNKTTDDLSWVDTSINLNTWYLLTAVIKNSRVYLYVNGQLIQTKNNLDDPATDYYYLGRRYTAESYFNGYLADLRVYDKALSEKEIIDLYNNRLILHYTFNTINPNLCVNSAANYSYSGFNESASSVTGGASFTQGAYLYNGLAVNTFAPGNPNATSGYPQACGPYTNTNGKMAVSLSTGQIYTISVYIKADAECNININSLAESQTIHSKSSTTITTDWKRFYVTFTAASTSFNSCIYVKSNSSSDSSIRVHYYGWKIEYGDTLTEWTDSKYLTFSDHSGMSLEPIKISNTSNLRVSDNTKIDFRALYANSTFTCPARLLGSTNFSYCFWAYKDNWDIDYSGTSKYYYNYIFRYNTNILEFCHYETYQSGGNHFTLAIDNASCGSIDCSSISSGWHYFVITTGESGSKVYMDGVQKISTSHNIKTALNNGRTKSGFSIGGTLDGLINDFKVYSKVLTQEEIQREYNLRAFIDNSYRFHAKMLKETFEDTHKIETNNYSYTGNVQTITLQPGTHFIECWGAGGFAAGDFTASKGGYSCMEYLVSTPTNIYCCIGGVGTGYTGSNNDCGGYNGGGGITTSTSTSGNRQASGGGGATHIALSNLGELKNYSNNRSDVLVVAGGGGGNPGSPDNNSTNNGLDITLAGNGGGLSGQSYFYAGSFFTASEASSYSGKPGTQTSGGAGGSGGGASGTFGQGGYGIGFGNAGAGGGGGWYGGGGSYGMTGGGGSGYCPSGSTYTPAESGFITNPDTSGNGYIRITSTIGNKIEVSPIVNNKGILETSTFIENEYINLDDGSEFLKIFDHTLNSSEDLFNSTEEASFCVTKNNKFSRLSDMEIFKSTDNKYEFLLTYPQYNKIPDEYEELEYLESDGTAYIDTGVTQTTSGTVDCKFYTSSYPSNYMFGSTQNSASMMYNGLYGRASEGLLEYNYQHVYYPVNNTITMEQKISGSNMVAIINGTTYTNPVGSSCDSSSIYLFACRNNSSGLRTYGVPLRCYYFKVKDNNVLKRDFIPVKRRADGKLGMYDLVQQKFYANAGSGSFTAGPFVNYTFRYNRWKQSKNPFNTNDNSETQLSMGYELVKLDWTRNWLYGLGISSSGITLFDAEQGHGDWWYAIGSASMYQGGMPGPDGLIANRVKLYARIDNTNFSGRCSMRKNCIFADEFIEE